MTAFISNDTAYDAFLAHGCRDVRVEHGLRHYAAELMAALDLGRNFLLISDPVTHRALGENILHSCKKAEHFLLPDRPHPDLSTARAIAKRAEEFDTVIAVGSGTVNDLCKYASYIAEKPYLVWGTALSMNGYLSANASLVESGIRKSLPARMPAAVFLDLDILAGAPRRLTRSGLGDALCRSTAQADWLLSHLLLGTAYDSAPFSLLALYEPALLAQAQALAHGDPYALHTLAMTLLLSGLGMTLAGGSYPASGGEHMIAHTMEIKHGAALPATYHGEQVGVAALTMAVIQQQCLEHIPRLATFENGEEEIRRYFGEEIAASLMPGYDAKRDAMEKQSLNEFLHAEWGAIAERISAIRLPYRVLEKALHDAGAPTAAENLGWREADYISAVKHARFSRNRFTFLDLA